MNFSSSPLGKRPYSKPELRQLGHVTVEILGSIIPGLEDVPLDPMGNTPGVVLRTQGSDEDLRLEQEVSALSKILNSP